MSYKADNTASRGGPSLKGLIHDYLEDVEISGRSELTVKRYSAYLDVFTEWLAFTTHQDAADLDIGDVTDERLRQYRLFLARRRDADTGRPIGPGTRNLYSISVRNLLKYAARKRKLDVPDPADALELAKERDVEIAFLDRDEIDRLREGVDLAKSTGLRDRTVIEVLFGTGVRVSELASLTIRQVDLDHRAAEVVGKGGRSRLVLLTDDAADWLRRYIETRSDNVTALFVGVARGQLRPLSVRQIQRVVDAAAKRAALPFRVSPHKLRHSRLTVLARHSGVQVAQRIAGHSSIATTSRYLHVTDAHLRKAFDDAEQQDRGDGAT